MADAAKRSTEECQKATTTISSDLAAKDQGTKELTRKLEAAEAARSQLESEAAATRQRLEAEVADQKSKISNTEAQVQDVQVKAH